MKDDSLVSSEEKGLSVEGVVESGINPVFGKPGAHFFKTLGETSVQNRFTEDPVPVSWERTRGAETCDGAGPMLEEFLVCTLKLD